jgi:NitT/TauT family transport system substrate-binding protein
MSELSRRALIAGSATALAMPAIAQGTPHIKMTLPWLAQGSHFFPFVARNKGYWKSRGLDVEIVRGFGSGAAIQTVMQGQCQAGIIAAPSVILAAAQGLKPKIFGIAGYDTTMGLFALADSPVKSLKDLEGRKLGSTPASTEVPFIDTYLKQSGVDGAKVARVALAANVLETTLMQRQVDAISGLATSQLSSLLGQGVKARFFPYAAQGIKIYSNALTTTPEFAAANPTALAAWIDGMNEALKFCMLNFDEAVQIFIKEVPEVKMTDNGEAYTRYGAGLFMTTLLAPELKANGLGWGDPAAFDKQIDLVMTFSAPADAKRPEVASLLTNELAGKIKISPAEWAIAETAAAPYADYLKS